MNDLHRYRPDNAAQARQPGDGVTTATLSKGDEGAGYRVWWTILLFTILVIMWGHRASAQAPATTEPGQLETVLIDGQTGAPVSFGSLALYPLGSTTQATEAGEAGLATHRPIASAMADEQGTIRLMQVRAGRYRLEARSVGYAPYRLDTLEIYPGALTRLGRLRLTMDEAHRLEEVTVETERPLMTLGLDRRSFDVGALRLTPDGTAADVLRNIPTVTVDGEGQVSLRNSDQVLIYIDGRPSGVSGQNRATVLAQIPAASIERIELITAPGARYDADGVSGIINIILKKNRKAGLNTGGQIGAGTWGNKGNASWQTGYRVGRLNLMGHIALRDQERWARGSAYRRTELTARPGGRSDTAFESRSIIGGDNRSWSHQGRLGADYDLGDGHSLSGSASGVITGRHDRERNEYRYFPWLEARDPEASHHTTRRADARAMGRNLDAALGYRYAPRGMGGPEWLIDVSGADYANRSRATYANAGSLPLEGPSSFLNAPNQASSMGDRFRTAIVQVDRVQPLPSSLGTIETGVKYIRRQADNDFLYQAGHEGAPVQDVPGQRYAFVYREGVASLYGLWQGRQGPWAWQGGVRYEHTHVITRLDRDSASGELGTIGIGVPSGSWPQRYGYIFPSGSISYQIHEHLTVQAAAGRRINRPGASSLNPFVDISDPLNLRVGNPALAPELTDNVELTTGWTPGAHTLTLTAFGRRLTGLHARRIDITPDGRGQALIINAGTRYDQGLEGVARVQVAPKASITVSGNLFASRILAPEIGLGIERRNLNYRATVLGTWQPAKGWQLQAASIYRSPFIMPQGQSAHFYNLDVSINRELWAGRGSVGLAVTDIANTLEFEMRARGLGPIPDGSVQRFDQRFFRKRETRVATLTFSYRIGGEGRSGKESPTVPGRRRRTDATGGSSEGGGGDGGF